MVLTPAGAAEFTLSTFADFFPTTGGPCCGPLGIAFPLAGGVMVADYPGNVRVFATDTDGQLASAGVIGQNFGVANGVGLTSSLSGKIYLTEQAAGRVVQLNNNGTLNHILPGSFPAATGIATNPVTGTIYVSTLGNNIIWKIDPITEAATPLVNASADGLTVNAAGTILYAEVNGHIIGYNTTTGLQVFDSGPIPGGPDGAAIGISGTLAGKLFVNTNAGQVIEVDLNTLAQTVIATGGTRGDFVTVDPLNDTLLITQTDDILRLTPKSGGFSGVPGPIAGAGLPGLLAMGGGLLGWLRRRRALRFKQQICG